MQTAKVAILFCVISLLLQNLHAQLCSDAPKHVIYFSKNTHESLVKTIFLKDKDSMYIVGSVNRPANGKDNHDVWIMFTNPKGTPIYSKAIGTSADETVNVIKQTPDGGYIIGGNTMLNSQYTQGWIAKLNHDCITEWSYTTSTFSSISNIVVLDEGGYAASGVINTSYKIQNGNVQQIDKSSNLVMRFDNKGNIIWYKAFRHTDKESLRPITQMNDHSLLVVGGTDNDAIDFDGYMIKMDINNGNIIWMNTLTNPNDRTFPSPVEREDGIIQLYMGNKIFNFDKNGKSTGVSVLNLSNDSVLANVSIARFGPTFKGQDIYFANIAKAPIVFSIENDSDVVWSRSYNPNNLKPITLRSGKVKDNHIYITGTFTGDKISDDENDNKLTYFVKADPDGYTTCSDTFNVKFNITQLPPQPNTSYDWINEGTIQLQKTDVTTTDLLPGEIIDCSVSTCCRDTLIYKDTTACAGSSFMLSNGTVVNNDSIYSVIYTNGKGCDSAVYTTVKFIQPYSFTSLLGNDTCLINNQPVTFNVVPVNGLNYKWQNGSVSSSFTATMPGVYYVTATSACNSFTDSVEVKERCDYPVYIPNSFTPNHDGLNDVFKLPELNDQHLLYLNIYNRYGNLIFTTKDAGKGWDGTVNNYLQPTGTYIYLTAYKDFAGKPHTLKGTIVLLR